MDWFLYDNGLHHERVKSLYFEETPFCKSFINIRNNKAISQDEYGLFRHYSLFTKTKKITKKFQKFPEIPFRFSLRSKSPCHNISKAFNISKKISLTSKPSTKNFMRNGN